MCPGKYLSTFYAAFDPRLAAAVCFSSSPCDLLHFFPTNSVLSDSVDIRVTFCTCFQEFLPVRFSRICDSFVLVSCEFHPV